MTPLIEPPSRVWIRPVSDAYPDCLRPNEAAGEVAAIDVDRARAQHRAYQQAFEAEGVSVEVVDADPSCPDGCFIEDAAVLWDGGGVVAPFEPLARRPEGPAVVRALAEAGLVLRPMPAGACLDGGDVLTAGHTLFVGRSARSNALGIDALTREASGSGRRVVPVELKAGLHLKSGVTMLDAQSALGRPDQVDLSALIRAGLTVLHAPEPAGANVLGLGRTVLVSAAAPKTARLIERLGFRVVVLELSEFHKGAGALSCLSLRLPRAGSWCA